MTLSNFNFFEMPGRRVLLRWEENPEANYYYVIRKSDDGKESEFKTAERVEPFKGVCCYLDSNIVSGEPEYIIDVFNRDNHNLVAQVKESILIEST